MSQFDYAGFHQFVTQTPEQGLRKMLVDGKPFSDSHLSLLLKIARGCSEADFVQHCEKKDFPKVKMGPAEQKIKDKFWDDCEKACSARGILQPSGQAA